MLLLYNSLWTRSRSFSIQCYPYPNPNPKEGDGIFDAVKMSPFFENEEGVGLRLTYKEKMTRLIAWFDFHHQELAVNQCVFTCRSRSSKKVQAFVSKFWKWMMWPKGFSRNSSYLISQGSVVLACEAHLSRVCSRRGVFWPWCWCKDSIDVVALPYRGAWIVFEWNGEDGASEWAQHVSQCLIAHF